jgi:hypothetical protein
MDALREVFDQVQSMKIDDISPDTVRQLYTLWWQTNEKRFFELFKSTEFTRRMNEVANHGFALKQRIDRINAEWCKAMSIPTMRDFDEMAEALQGLRKKVRLQEKVIEELRNKVDNV